MAVNSVVVSDHVEGKTRPGGYLSDGEGHRDANGGTSAARFRLIVHFGLDLVYLELGC